MNDFNKIGFCGLFCGTCKIYLATNNNTLNLLAVDTGISIDLLKCTGCRSLDVSLFCRSCAIKKCCIQKNIFSCADCNEFPCSVLKAFENDQHLHHKGVIPSLMELKATGKTKWLEKQINRWTCKVCGTPCSWYDEECGKCKKKFNGLKNNPT